MHLALHINTLKLFICMHRRVVFGEANVSNNVKHVAIMIKSNLHMSERLRGALTRDQTRTFPLGS